MIAVLSRKLCLFLISVFMVTVFAFSEEIDYSVFSSFEELISYETGQILNLSPTNYEDLSDAYISRGESYLLRGNYELALEDLLSGYKLAELCSQETKPTILLRSLFGLIISYGIMDKMDEFYFAESEIRDIFDGFDCRNPSPKKQDFHRMGFRSEYSLMQTQSEKPIIGPSKISVANCIERAQGTAKASRILILKASLKVQVILNILIDDLETRAVQCCLAGGVWKACLQPILNKWQKWNEKWNAFGIPPDPAWD